MVTRKADYGLELGNNSNWYRFFFKCKGSYTRGTATKTSIGYLG